MEKQYKLTDRVSIDALKSPTFNKWFKRVLCFVCILSLVLQLTLCCLPMQASAAEDDSIVGTWILNTDLDLSNSSSSAKSFASDGAVSIYYSNDGNNSLTECGNIYIVGG